MTDRERLAQCSDRDLREWACESYKDINGMKARWMLAESYPIEGVKEWILSHFTWDAKGEFWTFADDVTELAA